MRGPINGSEKKNRLKTVDEIEDYFFYPHFNKLLEQLELPEEKRTKHIQASTISSKLTSLNHFVLFLVSRHIYVGQLCVFVLYFDVPGGNKKRIFLLGINTGIYLIANTRKGPEKFFSQ